MKKILIFGIVVTAFLFGMSSVSAQSTCEDLMKDGTLSGSYFYEYPTEGDTSGVPFTINITASHHTQFSGISVEPNTFISVDNLKKLRANIYGRCTNGILSFSKKYTFKKGHTVLYKISIAENVGTWKIPGSNSGFWKLTR